MRRVVLFSSFSIASSLALFACVGDDTNVPLAAADDAGHHDATTPQPDAAPAPDATTPTEAGLDAGIDAPVDAAPLGPFLLLSYTFQSYAKSEYAAFSLPQAQSLGHLQYAKYGTNMSTVSSPWVLNQYGDVVFKMDPAAPWKSVGSWTVAEPKNDAGGSSNSDAYSVAETPQHKAYVALFNRDVIPVLDTTQTADAGAPTKTIDLHAIVQPGDSDGYVEAVALAYDATRSRVWVVLGNIDLNNVDPQGFFAICTAGLKSTVVAIDTTTDTLVNGVSYALKGVDPTSVTYDAKNDRLVIMSAGCNEPVDGGDGGQGTMFGRVIESIKLSDGTSTLLFDGNAQPYPGGLEYVDEHHAFVGFGGTHAWDPTSTTLGAAITNAPDTFVWDGKGLLGPRSSYLADGGLGSIDVIRVDVADGGVTKLGSNPVSQPDPSGYFEGIDLWPHP